MLGNEKMITLTEAAKLAPGRPHATAVWRWCRKGITARDGSRVHLEHTRFGRRVFTSVEALARFGERLAEADRSHFDHEGAQAQDKPRRRHTPNQRRKAIARAEAALVAAGVTNE